MGGVDDLGRLSGLRDVYFSGDFDFSKGLEDHGRELCYKKDDNR